MDFTISDFFEPIRTTRYIGSENYTKVEGYLNELIKINHKLAPLLLTKDGNIWMAICLVTLSSRKESGDVHIIMQDDLSRYDLNDSKDSFENTQQKNLTKKEIEVLKCIAVGKKIKDIAKKLDISVSTVKNHKTNIFKKIGANTAAEAVFFAGKQNII